VTDVGKGLRGLREDLDHRGAFLEPSRDIPRLRF
jgi:hypothetical protein